MRIEQPIHIVGGGLAGSEAAWQIAARGLPVVLHEMRPVRPTDAHRTDSLAELVCSNSFRSDDQEQNAVGLLHEEMRRLGSLVMRTADEHKLPAGGALAVDRDGFAAGVTAALQAHPLVTIVREEVTGLPPEDWDSVIIATGPLTSAALADSIQRLIDGLIAGDKTVFKEWEASTPYFDGCLPIEIMAERGRETLRHGPMKPFGLTNPHRPQEKAYAVVQLRQDNRLGTLFNMVGFQTKLKHSEQVRIFRTIPGLEHAEFARLGGLHRNTFLNSPRLLDRTLRLKAMPRARFAGQITGCEGYVESAAVGLMAGRFAAAERFGEAIVPPPSTTAHVALLAHITGGHVETIDAGPRSFQPMNVNFGLFPPLERAPQLDSDGHRLRGTAKTMAKKRALSARALADLAGWIAASGPALAAE
jgi:methylenetetrahydrofolate--tRNA-(uracil-5-)-methyltransferase